MTSKTAAWWRDAVIYQVYPRSFADGNGDGIGDLPGIISRLDYLRDLGVDAVWISPFYTSPQNDAGYDVANYRDVDPLFGSLADMDVLIKEAHARNLRIFMDIVPNHTSSEHPWWQEVLRSEPGSPAWDRYMIREGKGADKEEPPNNWRSVFHGRGWSHVRDQDGNPTGYWYLHLFDTTQPDLNWSNPQVREEFRNILRFWFDRGVDGFRIDVAHGLVKEAGLPDADNTAIKAAEAIGRAPEAPFWDQDGVHVIYREWREVADSYDPPRVFCGETWVAEPERLALYQRPDELHTSFNFGYLTAGWDADAVKASVDSTVEQHAKVDAPPTWVLSNHDVTRHRTRLAPGYVRRERGAQPDLVRGLDRARAATLFTLALPGSAYLYQGEEFGLFEVFELPDELREDPIFIRSKGEDLGRDGCRVPIPWSGTEPSYGFGPGSASWLPQPKEWAELSAEALTGAPDSTLEFYRSALALRHAEPSLGEGPMTWRPLTGQALALERNGDEGAKVLAAINFGETSVELPAEWGTDVLIGSGESFAEVTVDESTYLVIGPDTCVWLRV